MEIGKGIENSGIFLGEKALKPTLNYLRNSYTERFNVATIGAENLREIIDKPHILFSNHNALKDINKDSGMRPDHLFIFKKVYDLTGERLVIVAQTDNGPNTKDSDEKFLIPLTEGLYKGTNDIINVRNKPGKLNKNFILDMNSTFDEKKRSILIFPQVVGEIDYNPNLPFGAGIYHVFKNRQKQNLEPIPLIPVCVNGCDSWKPYDGQEIKISFGKSFYFPEGSNKNEVSEIMKNKISEARSRMEF
jgi:1-acyl-sn-glycerol-3-phosphate acyltransferase